MNRTRIPPFLLVAAVLIFAALACQLSPKAISDAPREPTTVTLSIPTSVTDFAQVVPTSAGSEIQTPVEFSEADCACGGLPVSKAFPWGESIECRYDWSGANVDDNLLGFTISRDYHVEQWGERFPRDREDLTAEYTGGGSDQAVNEFLNSSDAYGFMTTRMGWSRDNVEIPVCGFGKSEQLYAGEWLILTDLRSCELPNSMSGYLDQIRQVQQCARTLVDTKTK